MRDNTGQIEQRPRHVFFMQPSCSKYYRCFATLLNDHGSYLTRVGPLISAAAATTLTKWTFPFNGTTSTRAMDEAAITEASVMASHD